jgi:xanthine dehydrogenase YagR molybdenum-binding subunit
VNVGVIVLPRTRRRIAVDADLGIVRVRQLAGAFAPGRVLNPRTARSQLMGGMLWGMSQALLEGNRMDARTGRWASASLGDYLVPVNADAPLSAGRLGGRGRVGLRWPFAATAKRDP